MIEPMKGVHRIGIGLAVVAVLMAIGWWLLKDATIDVLSPTGVVAEQQKQLLIFTIILSSIVVIPVFTLLAVFAYKYRETNPTHKGYDPEWKENAQLEAIWWGIPIVIIGILAVVTWQTSHSLDPYKKIDAEHPAIPIQVIALQWKWLFIYPDDDLAMTNKVILPKDVPVTFYLTADAPMSAFWIPSLGSQIYNMNGMTSELNVMATKTGMYKGYTTNINGKGYADMTFDVAVRTHKEYHEWLESYSQTGAEVLTDKTLAKLRQPSIDTSQSTYSVASDIYSQIMGRYMLHSDMTHSSSTHSEDHATMESMHAHEEHH